MICGDHGRFANARNLLSQSIRFLVLPDEAKDVVDAMKDHVKGAWYEVARSAGVSEKDCERISGAFAYPGFDIEELRPTGGH